MADIYESAEGDNQGTIAMAKNPVSHSRTEHIDIKYHYVREAIPIQVTYCPTENMVADLPLPRVRHQSLRKLIGIVELLQVGYKRWL